MFITVVPNVLWKFMWKFWEVGNVCGTMYVENYVGCNIIVTEVN
jgi:hypothetical protein